MISKNSQLQIRIITLIMVIGLILLSGCSNDNNSTVEEDDDNNSTIEEEDGNDDYAPAADDVVDKHGDITNLRMFEDFMESVEEDTKDKIRVVRYTTEGDPMLKDLEYDGETISVTDDTTRDEFGDGQIIITTCQSINKNNTENGMEYTLNECDISLDDDVILTVDQ